MSKISLFKEYGWDGKGVLLVRHYSTTARNARKARAPPRMSRDWLPTDAGRRLWIGAVGGSSRWNGEGRGGGRNDRSTYVALRGGRCPRDPMDTGNRWEYTRREYIQGESFRCARRNELKKSFLQFFLFLQRVELGCFCRGRWEFNFDRVRRGGRNVFYVQRKNVFFLFSWEEKVKRERVNLIDEILLIMWKRRMYRVKLFRNFVKIYLF